MTDTRFLPRQSGFSEKRFWDPEPLNMLSLVLAGNGETRRVVHWVYTPRGYHAKPELAGQPRVGADSL